MKIRKTGKKGRSNAIIMIGGFIAFILGIIYMFIPGLVPGGSMYPILTLAVIVFITGIYLFINGFQKRSDLKLIENIPTSKVRSMSMGLVEIFGEIQAAEETLQSPFSDKECVHYQYEVFELRNSGKNNQPKWHKIDRGRKSVKFYLQDDTGKVLVDPKEAEIRIPLDNEFKVAGGKKPPKPIEEFIKQNKNVDSENKELDLKIIKLRGGNKRKYKEKYIQPGENIYVMGKAMHQDSKVIIGKDQATPMFFISDSAEKELVKSLKWEVYLKIFGGAILILLGFGGILFTTMLA